MELARSRRSTRSRLIRGLHRMPTLLVRRRRDPEAGCWGLPGGKVDPFEPVADAAAREINEELGIIIRPSELLCLVDQIDRTEGHHWIALCSA